MRRYQERNSQTRDEITRRQERDYERYDTAFKIWRSPPPSHGKVATTNITKIDEYNGRNSERIKKTRHQQLITSLSKLRTPECSDVTLVADEQEFFAHKVVLEASSPYFVTMFRSGMEEAVSGRIVFKEMKPEILGIILDYLYLGEITKLTSKETVKEVLINAHLLELTELFECCGNILEVTVSAESFSELWQFGLKYDHKGLTEKVKHYVQTNLREVVDSPHSLLLSTDQIQMLLTFLDGKLSSSDMILQLLVKWLIHDTDERDNLARDLLTRIDAKRVTKECIKSLLQSEEIMKASEEIANRMNEFGVTVFLTEDSVSTENSEQMPSYRSAETPLRQNRFQTRKTSGRPVFDRRDWWYAD